MEFSGSTTTTADALAEARAALVRLQDVIWAVKSPDEVLAALEECERLRSTLASLELELAVEVEAGEHAKAAAAWPSTQDYLTAISGSYRGAGGRMLRTGQALCAEQQATFTALQAGEISPEHAEVIANTMRRLPTDSELRARAEQLLLAEAAKLNASELKIAGLKLWEVIDPDGYARSEERKLKKHERSAHLNRFLKIVDDGLGGVVLKGRGSAEDGAVLKAALASLSAPTAQDFEDTDPEHGNTGRDLRDHGARLWDAAVAVAQKALDTETLPTDHGRKPRVVVNIDLEDLRTGEGEGVLETGERLSASAVRRLACHAEIIPVVLDGESRVIDVGRARRLATGAVWTALVARDGHCRFPGCRRPPIACDAHHIVHWADGGGTDQDNLVLLCGAHHRIIHSTPWEVRFNKDLGVPEFLPAPNGRQPRERMLDQIEPAAPDDPDDAWIRERRPRG
jgi:hypothetical protein